MRQYTFHADEHAAIGWLLAVEPREGDVVDFASAGRWCVTARLALEVPACDGHFAVRRATRADGDAINQRSGLRRLTGRG